MTISTTNPALEAQLRKGLLEVFVLMIIGKDNLYPAQIVAKAKEHELDLSEGTLYPLLSRLKSDKKLDVEWVESLQGPPRKYYKLTELGLNSIQDNLTIINKLNQILDKLQKN